MLSATTIAALGQILNLAVQASTEIPNLIAAVKNAIESATSGNVPQELQTLISQAEASLAEAQGAASGQDPQ